MKRSEFLYSTAGLLGLGLLGQAHTAPALGLEKAPFTLPNLAYGYEALEPHFDRLTMEIHHSRHHKAYIDNLNKALQGQAMGEWSLEELLAKTSQLPALVRNNAGGHWNHRFLWSIIGPAKEQGPSKALSDQILKDFGSMDAFKTQFNQAAMSRFGSGWAWLTWNGKQLQISSSPNQDNPLMDLAETKGKPLMGIDVWEHAYYLKYQNKRADYIQAFWKVLNWEAVSANFQA